VNSLMLGKGGAMCEGLAALTALIWLLPSVDSPVLSEVGALPEGLSTLMTFVGLLPGMCPLMLT
jgi:hypothetical protein